MSTGMEWCACMERACSEWRRGFYSERYTGPRCSSSTHHVLTSPPQPEPARNKRDQRANTHLVVGRGHHTSYINTFNEWQKLWKIGNRNGPRSRSPQSMKQKAEERRGGEGGQFSASLQCTHTHTHKITPTHTHTCWSRCVFRLIGSYFSGRI